MFNQLKALLIVAFLTIAWITPAQAVIPWQVVDSYVVTTKTFGSKTLPGTVTTTTETATEQYKDADGNTVEKTTVSTFEITSDIIEKTVQKRRIFKMEKVNRRGILKTKTHKSRTWRETERTTSAETKTLVDTQVTETIVAYAPKPETTTTASSNSSLGYADSDFGANADYLGTRTEMPSNNPDYYANLNEFGTHNSVANQDSALARGWTGKGSTIAILDSGIDLDHSEFNSPGKIVFTKDMTGTGMQDNIGHGTHVAGIAAAEMDGTGTMGIAPDANLAIVKITDNWGSSMMKAKQGMKAVIDAGVDVTVFNLSSNVNYSSDYRNSVIDQGNGIYISNHSVYGGANYYNLEKPQGFTNKLIGNDAVLVISAGNQSNDYVQNPATFATATDADGNLLGDGRILIAGHWNNGLNVVEGGKAGHVCKNYSAGQCNDAYRTSDFYILAEGSGIVSSDMDGGYRTFSGTSQAAPTVSGAVAVIHQMWPYMKGNQIVKVLTTTADKTIEGYDVNVHGQGVLDLDKATQPLGDVGISYTGRTGTTVPLSGGIALAGVDDSTLSSLSSVSVVDSIGRDYRINLTPATTTVNSMIPVYQLDHSVGSAWSSKFVGGAMEANGLHFGTYEVPGTLDRQSFTNVTLGFDDTMFMKRDPHTGKVLNPSAWTSKFMYTQSYGSPYMAFSGMWGQVESSQTFEFSQMYKPNNWYGQVGVMYTTTQFKQGLVTEVDPITSMYGVAGWANDNLNLYVGIKPTVVSGNVHLNVPTSVDSLGTMHYTNVKASLTGDPISYVGAQFNVSEVKDKFNNEHSLKMNGVVDQYGDYRAGAFYEFSF